MDQNQMTPEMMKAMMMGLEDPSEDPAMIKMARQQKMVEALRGQAMKNTQGQMVGGRYVNPSATTQVLNAVTMGLGGLSERGMDKQQEALGAKRTAARSAYTDRLIKAMRAQGAPSQGTPLQYGPRGGFDQEPDDGFVPNPVAGY